MEGAGGAAAFGGAYAPAMHYPMAHVAPHLEALPVHLSQQQQQQQQQLQQQRQQYQQQQQKQMVPAWVQLFDHNSGNMYFYNRLTGVTQWEQPEVFQPVALMVVPSTANQNTPLWGGDEPYHASDYSAYHPLQFTAQPRNLGIAKSNEHGQTNWQNEERQVQVQSQSTVQPSLNTLKTGESISEPNNLRQTSSENKDRSSFTQMQPRANLSDDEANTSDDEDDDDEDVDVIDDEFFSSDLKDVRCWGRPGRSMTLEDLDECTTNRFRSISSMDPQSLKTLAELAAKDKIKRSGKKSPLQSSSPGESLQDATFPSLQQGAFGLPGSARTNRERANTTNTINITSSMTDPDASEELACVSAVIHAHMIQFLLQPQRENHPRYEIFNEPLDDAPSAGDLSSGATSPSSTSSSCSSPREMRRQPSYARIGSVLGRHSSFILRVPTREAVLGFVQDVYQKAQMEKECLIMSFAYLERLLNATKGQLSLNESNWRAVVLSTMILASKVYDDLSMLNADFSLICPSFTLKRINALEVCLLEAIKYEVRVSTSEYAKYYFKLRSVRATLEVKGDDSPVKNKPPRRFSTFSRSPDYGPSDSDTGSIHSGGTHTLSSPGNPSRERSRRPRALSLYTKP